MTIVCLGEAIVDLVCERELDAPRAGEALPGALAAGAAACSGWGAQG